MLFWRRKICRYFLPVGKASCGYSQLQAARKATGNRGHLPAGAEWGSQCGKKNDFKRKRNDGDKVELPRGNFLLAKVKIIYISLCSKKIALVLRRAFSGWLGEPKNYFQIYRHKNSSGQAILSLQGDIQVGISKN